MSLDKMPFNWFDLVLLVVLGLGLHFGRKRGLSEELFGVLKWLSLVVFCSIAYQPVGEILANSPAFNLLYGYIVAYIGTALVVAALFALLKKLAGGKLVGSDVFGRGEFYLGMCAGMLRFLCVLVMILALLNARDYREFEVKADIKKQNEVYGSNFFPKLYTLQAAVFQRSISGRFFKNQLGFLLIKPTVPEKKELKRKEVDM